MNPRKPIYERGRRVRPQTRQAQIPGTDQDYPTSLKTEFIKTTIKIALKMKHLSWKTSLGGILIAAGPVLKEMLPPQWNWVGDALLVVGGLVMGTYARDNSVTSEEAGAK